MVRNYVHIKDNIAKLRTFSRPPYGITDNDGSPDVDQSRSDLALARRIGTSREWLIYQVARRVLERGHPSLPISSCRHSNEMLSF